jgi:serine/threonine protein kinase/WD40 repeat protein
MLDHPSALDDLIAGYLELLDAGKQVAPEEYVAERPELRDDFLKFIANSGVLQDWISPAGGDAPDPGQFAGFDLIKELGRGGMGIVYHAVRQTDGQPIALKVLRAFGNSNQSQRTRFRREAQAIASLNHPHIVPLVGSDEAQGVSYLAMQLIDGVTIADVIAEQKNGSRSTGSGGSRRNAIDSPGDKGGVADETAVEMKIKTPISGQSAAQCLSRLITLRGDYFHSLASCLADVADALQHAHESGVIHRDVKPSNLLLDTDGHVWLTDFGLASRNDEQTVATATGDVLGTPIYMSPEQAMGTSGNVSQLSDIYSLGATLYELATLHKPFDGSRQEVLLQVIRGEFPTPRRVRADLPRQLEAIIVKAMSLSPLVRYASAAELARDLRRFVAGETVVARLPGVMGRIGRWSQRNPRVALAAAIGTAATIAAVIAVQTFNSQQLARLNDRLGSTNALLESTNADLSVSNQQLIQSQATLRQNLYTADMAAAYRAYNDLDLVGAGELLSRHVPAPGEPDLRGIEWRLLSHLIKPPESTVLVRHDQAGTEAAFVPGTSQVVSVGHDGVVKVVDLNQPETPIEFQLKGKLDAIAVSPDGKSFVTGENVVFGLNRVVIRAMHDGRVLQRLTGHQYAVESAVFSPDGKLVATAGRYQDVLVHTTDGKLVKRITTNSRNESLRFTPDGKYLVTLMRGEDRATSYLRGWSVADFEATVDLFRGQALAIAFAADSNRLAVLTDMHAITVVDWPGGELLAETKGIRGRIRCLAISPDGQTLAAGCDQGIIYIWTLESADFGLQQLPLPASIQASDQGITSVSIFSAVDDSQDSGYQSKQTDDDKQLLVTAEDGSTTLWELHRSNPGLVNLNTDRVSGPQEQFVAMFLVDSAKHPDVVFLRSTSGELVRFDACSETNTRIAQIDPDRAGCFALSVDERRIVAATPDDLVLVDVDSGEIVQRIRKQVNEKECLSLAFDRDGNELLALFNDHLCRYRIQPQRIAEPTSDSVERQLIRLPNDQAHELLAVPGQQRFVVMTTSTLLQLDGDQLSVLMSGDSLSNGFGRGNFSRDGSLLAVCRGDCSLDVFDFRDRLRPIATFRGHKAGVLQIRFTADQRTLATSAYDETIRFWDLATRRELGTLRMPGSRVLDLHLLDQERMMLTAGIESPVQLWSAASQ